MAAPTKNKWLTITLLAIILPVTLLITFKLTGVIPEPQTPETVVVEAKVWNVIRPPEVVTFCRWIENSYSDDVASVNLGVDVDTYDFRYGWTLYEYLMLHIVASTNTSEGFIHSMIVEFHKGDNYTSIINIMEDPELLELHNLNLQKVRDSEVGLRENYIITTGKDRPDNCRLVTNVDWIFLNKDIDHNVTITLKTTYFNGTTYKKVVIPVRLNLWAGAGNSFETALTISSGCYEGYFDRRYNQEDYYAVFLKADQTIHAQATSQLYLDVDLYLYDPDKNPVANSSLTGIGGTEKLTFKADSTGLWFIRLSAPSMPAYPLLYKFEIDISSIGA